ncbi:MAG: VF530 family protein [Arcobacteraceae bacterium]
MNNNPNDLLHGLTLQTIVNKLVEFYGWEELGKKVNINCFKSDPSVKSSLKFLRKTYWARLKVEKLYIKTFIQKDESDTVQ